MYSINRNLLYNYIDCKIANQSLNIQSVANVHNIKPYRLLDSGGHQITITDGWVNVASFEKKFILALKF